MPRCSVIKNSGSAAHDLPGHPECEARLSAVLAGVPPEIPVLAAGPVSDDEIALVHDRSYIDRVRERCRDTRTFGFLDPDTYITPASFDVAAGAAGCAIAAVERSLAGEHSFALVRPPGHHAERTRSLGFCIFNNAAIAAAAALQSANRVAIVDWDYHHGNGTQAAFYDSGRVLYCSVHHGGAFPYTGSLGETGAGAGAGLTINAPLPAGSTIADYRLVFSDVFCPAITRFDPDVVIISAGQDILSDDPLGMMEIYPQDFELLTGLCKNAAGVPLALVLEGGYGPSHGKAIAHIFRSLKTASSDALDPAMPPVLPETAGLVASLRAMHRL